MSAAITHQECEEVQQAYNAYCDKLVQQAGPAAYVAVPAMPSFWTANRNFEQYLHWCIRLPGSPDCLAWPYGGGGLSAIIQINREVAKDLAAALTMGRASRRMTQQPIVPG